jgi:hypothetical protein
MTFPIPWPRASGARYWIVSALTTMEAAWALYPEHRGELRAAIQDLSAVAPA